MHNTRIVNSWMVWLTVLLPWVATAQPLPVVRSVLTTNLPAFGSAGQGLFRTTGAPFVNWSNVLESIGITNAVSGMILNSNTIVLGAVTNATNTLWAWVPIKIGESNMIVLTAVTNATNTLWSWVNISLDSKSNFIVSAHGTVNVTNTITASNVVSGGVKFGSALGNSNIVVGASAMTTNSGSDNVVIGDHALSYNTTGGSNVAIGSYALARQTTGENNTAVGFHSMYWSQEGTHNTAVGKYTLYDATNTTANTALGYASGVHSLSNGYNTSVGYQSLHNNRFGFFNTAVGYNALYTADYVGAALDVQYNTAVGANAGDGITTGRYNTFLGAFAGSGTSSPAQSGTVVGASSLGYGATANADVSTAIGYMATTAVAHEIALGTASEHVLIPGSANIGGGAYVNFGGGLNPVGAYGSLMMNATNIIVCAGAASVYTNVAGTGFTTIVTNGFFGNTAAIAAGLTNLYAGWYRVTICVSALGANNQATEWEIFTNGVACDLIGMKKTFDAAARMDDLSMTGIVYLPANCGTQFMVQDGGSGGSIAIHRASLTIGTP